MGEENLFTITYAGSGFETWTFWLRSRGHNHTNANFDSLEITFREMTLPTQLYKVSPVRNYEFILKEVTRFDNTEDRNLPNAD